MKKLTVLILLTSLCLSLFCGCANTGANVTESTEAKNSEPVVLNNPLFDGKTLKVLAIGNSFSNDTTEYLYDIAIAEGATDVIIGRLYYGACSVQQHATFAESNKPSYDYYKNSFGYWEKTENVTMLQGLQDEDWDIITMQQSSGDSGIASSYDGCLEELIAYVKENKTNPDAKLVWNMTWAYQNDCTHAAFEKYGRKQDVMYKAITDTVKSVILPTEAFEVVIPAGTAIQNARSGQFGDTLTIDGYHLNTLGRVITAYTWYGIFAGKQFETINLTAAGSSRLTTDEKVLILTSVNAALANPYEAVDLSQST